MGKFFTKSFFALLTMNNLILSASTNFLLKASNASNGARVFALVNPNDMMNFLIASGLIPLLRNASKVGSLGSSYHVTFPSSIRGLMILFDIGIPLNSNLEKKPWVGFLIFNASKIASISSFLSSNSFER